LLKNIGLDIDLKDMHPVWTPVLSNYAQRLSKRISQGYHCPLDVGYLLESSILAHFQQIKA